MTEPIKSQVHLRRMMETFSRMEENRREIKHDLKAMREHAAFIEQALRDRVTAERKAEDGEV